MLVLSGGTGTPKLLQGLKALLLPKDLSVVVNTGEDLWVSGNYVSPDIDSVLYTLCDRIDEEKWWGIKGDKTATHDFLMCLGVDETLLIGDLDRAVHIYRSNLMRRGSSLSDATASLAFALGIEQKVVPMTDDTVSTYISTSDGIMHFQDYWVANRGKPDVSGLSFAGIEKAYPCPYFIDLLDKESTVLIGPSNPVTSIGPILALPGIRDRLKEKRVIAMSPLIGNKPVSGPAAKFMQACGYPANDEGIRELIGKVDLFIVDKKSDYPGDSIRMNTLMRTRKERIRVAEELLDIIGP